MRTTLGLALVGLGIVLPPGVGALGTWAVLASWAATLGGLLLLLRAPHWRRAAISGIALLNALVALAATGAGAVALRGGRAAVSAAGLGFADTAVAAGVLAASFAGGLALALSPDVRARVAARIALGAGALCVYAFGTLETAFLVLVGLVYALLTFSWGLAMFDSVAVPAGATRPASVKSVS